MTRIGMCVERVASARRPVRVIVRVAIATLFLLVTTVPIAPSADALLPRATADRADDITGNQVHAFYVLPSDRVDRALDTNGTLAGTVASFNKWLGQETGGRELRLDTFNGELDVTFFRLSRTDAQMAAEGVFIRDRIEEALTAAGHIKSNKIYAVYYDGSSTSSCASGAWPPTLPGRVGAVYLRNGACFAELQSAQQPPGYWEFAMLHEILHTLGFVAQCAPNHHRAGHTSDNANDVMWAGEGFWFPDGYDAAVLDAGRDDYYGHTNGSCLDFADSPYLGPK
jgi:hypothetical protein